MKQLFHKLTQGLAALIVAGGAQAGVITFDGPTLDTSNAPFAPGLLQTGDVLIQAGVGVGLVNLSGDTGLVGSLIDGTNGTCDTSSMRCPANNSTYLASLNDGIPAIFSLTGDPFRLVSFRAAFIGDLGFINPRSSGVPAGLIRLFVVTEDGSSGYLNGQIQLDGTDASGNINFATFTMPESVNGLLLTEVDFVAFSCNNGGNCNAFTTNRGQIALDDIELPEPGELLLVAAALGALAFARRARRNA